MKCNAYHIFFGALSNPLKIQVITELNQKSSSVNELAKKLNIEQSKLSHSLTSLKNCSIITEKQKGKFRIYSLNKKTMAPILKVIDKHKENFCKKACPLK